jgi:hypothetical protein
MTRMSALPKKAEMFDEMLQVVAGIPFRSQISG